MGTERDFTETERAYYIAGMVVVAQALGRLPIAARIEAVQGSLHWLLSPGAVAFSTPRSVRVRLFASERGGTLRRRTEEELQYEADRAIDAETATVLMAGRAAVQAYHAPHEPPWSVFEDMGRRQAFELAAKYSPAPFDQLLFVEAAYLRALRALGNQRNRRGVQAVAQALMSGRKLAADDIGALLARAGFRRRARRVDAP
jgi:hypothetical protein